MPDLSEKGKQAANIRSSLKMALVSGSLLTYTAPRTSLLIFHHGKLTDESPFERRAMKVEIVDGLDVLLSAAAADRVTAAPVREGDGSGGGT
jgi:hypothetical protein